MLKRLLSIGLLIICSIANAASLKPMVVLNSIKQIQKTERHGDELYLTVTSFPTKKKASHRRIPNYPLFWPGRNIANIKDLTLWHDELVTGEGVRLLISLIEQDSPPWDLDDEIGSLDLKLHNMNGKLLVEWQRPNQNDNKKLSIKGIKQDLTIEFSGHDQTYQINLGIKTN